MISKSDSRVILLLLLIAVVCVCVMFFSKAANGDDGNEDVQDGDGKELVGKEGKRTDRGFVEVGRNLGTFDPNTADSLTLTRYGLGSVQIHSLLNYRRHNGTFDKPLAVSRLYNWSDADVDKVLPYIRIGGKYKRSYHYREVYEKEREAEYEYVRKPYKHRVYDRSDGDEEGGENTDTYVRKYDLNNKFTSLTKVDLNSADTSLLKRIPGVGSGIANAIVKLRGKLGGFYKVEQLAELKFISSDLYEWFKVETPNDLHLININKASFQVLNAHPYISYNQVRDLMNYRRLYGSIKDRNALIGTHIFTKEEVERLDPYLEY